MLRVILCYNIKSKFIVNVNANNTKGSESMLD